MQIPVHELQDLVRRTLAKQGYNEQESATLLEVMMYAQLRGNNQGIVKLIGKGMPKNPSAGELSTVRDTKLSALIDGGQNPGMVVMTLAMDKAVAKAKEHGFGMVGTFNTSSSTGAIGYYANKIAQEGLIGWVFAGSPETVRTHGS